MITKETADMMALTRFKTTNVAVCKPPCAIVVYEHMEHIDIVQSDAKSYLKKMGMYPNFQESYERRCCAEFS